MADVTAITAAILVSICFTLLIALVYLKSRKPSHSRKPPAAADAHVVQRGGVARRAARLRRRDAQVQPAVAADEDSAASSDDEEVQLPVGRSRAARLAARKAAKRAAKEEARQAREQEGEDSDEDEKPPIRSAYEESRRQKEREREALEAAQEEEIRLAQEEAQRREAEEFETWRGAISIEDHGEAAATQVRVLSLQAQEEEMMEATVSYIMDRKVVTFEELSAEFKVRTKDVVERIKALEDSGRLTGITDDRGKYIYLSAEELASVAQHIRKQGRISISSLSKTASTLLDLEGKGTDAPDFTDADLLLDELAEE